MHAGCGAIDVLDCLFRQLRVAWPGGRIRVRSDNGLAVPGLYDYCEAQNLPYAFGYASNAVLERATAWELANRELYHHFYRHREPVVQAFLELTNYQAGSWPWPRRIVAKLEVTPQGSQRRYSLGP